MIEHTKDNRIKNFIKGIVVLVIYFCLSFFRDLPLTLIHIDYNALSTLAKELYNLSLEFVIIAIIFMIFEEEFRRAWHDLKQNHMKHFTDNFKYYLIGLFLMYGANMLINILGGGLSGNETTIRDQFKLAPIFTFVSSVFIAPILEESVFRLSFRSIIKNNFLFILISGLVFGSLHLLAGVDMNLIFLYLIAYSSFGFVFAYMLVKTNNIFVSTGFHLMHNGILMSIQMLVFLFG